MSAGRGNSRQACLAGLITAGLFFGACSGSGRIAPEDRFLVEYCEAEDVAKAFSVVVVKLDAPVHHETYRFPVEKRSVRIADHAGRPVEFETCVQTIRGSSADNPFAGTGHQSSVYLIDADETGARVAVGLSWKRPDGTPGEVDERLSLEWGGRLRRQPAPDVSVDVWFEDPAVSSPSEGKP
jgi:hypothetical protein